MFSLNNSNGGDCDIEKEKPRIIPTMFPNFAQFLNNFSTTRSFTLPGSSTTSTSSTTTQNNNNNNTNLFPIFPTNINPYALMQQNHHLLNQLTSSSTSKNGFTTINSDSSNNSRSSSVDSSSKKLQPDSDGNICCPVCDQKFSSNINWENHLEDERKWLISKIEKIKDQKSNTTNDTENLSDKTQLANRQREKRETELQRIRINQQKRLSWKNISPLSTRNSETSSSSYTSPIYNDKSYCKGCDKQHEYLVISSIIDEPRCLDCFQKYRKQMTFLPLSITESPVDEKLTSPVLSTSSSILNHTVDELLNRKRKNTNDDNDDDLVKEKQIKIEI